MPLDVLLDPADGPDPKRISVGVIRLPHISNFTDFNPLERESAVALHYLARPRRLEGYDIIFLPGSKNVRFDLEWLESTGWKSVIDDYIRNGGRIAGVCGGYQMLGTVIHDPHGVEGAPGTTTALGLLNVETTLQPSKLLTRTQGHMGSAVL